MLSNDLNYQKLFDFGPQMVYPNYVGNCIQTMIIKDLNKISKEKGYKYALSTTHPDNIFSINNLLKNDFLKIGEVTLKRGQKYLS